MRITGNCAAAATLVLLLTACASDVVSTRFPEKGIPTGVPYALPRTILLLTLHVAQTQPPKPDSTDASEKHGRYAVDIVVEAQRAGDPAHRYLASIDKSITSSDVVRVEVNDRGLLTSVKADTTDDSAAVIQEALAAVVPLVETARAVKDLGDGAHAKALPDCPSVPDVAWSDLAWIARTGPRKLTLALDGRANRASHASVRGGNVGWHLRARLAPGASQPAVTGTAPSSGKGVFVRLAERRDLEISLVWRQPVPGGKPGQLCDEEYKTAVHSLVAPDYSPIVLVPIETDALVRSTTNLTLADGMLAVSDVNRPSSASAIIGIPVAAAKAIVEVPAQLAQFRVNSGTEESVAEEGPEPLTERWRLALKREREETALVAFETARGTALLEMARLADLKARSDATKAQIQEQENAVGMAKLLANLAADAAKLPRPFTE